jgi:hypothetical protein
MDKRKSFGRTYEKNEGLCYVLSVIGLNMPNTETDDDDDDDHLHHVHDHDDDDDDDDETLVQ